jgi:mannose-6-phosphate isomerase-like protein (cupin superfamily)
MAAPYTLKKLAEVEDSAPAFGLAEFGEVRFANQALETERTGCTYHRLNANARPGFAHRHQEAEEVYVVLSGSGRIKLDDEIVEVEALDAIRVSPTVTRSMQAGPDGLELLAFGARHENDGEAFTDWWTD